jgi:type IV pilus assembly protein PilM
MVSLTKGRHNRTPIGLDVGESGVRAVQLEHTADRYCVMSAAALGDQPTADAAAAGGPEQLSLRIQRCIRTERLRGRSVVSALNPPAVEFHTLDLPPAVLKDPKADVAEVVRWEVGRLMNQPVEAIETRHWALPTTQTPAPNAIGVTARRESVSGLLDACGRAGLICTCVDAGATALSRLGYVLNAWCSDQVWGVLDVGYRDSRLVLCAGDVPVLIRRAGSGGNVWTTRIAELLHVSAKAAEVHKRDHGIALTGRGTRQDSVEAPVRELASIMLSAVRSELKDLAAEVKRSYEYVLSCYPQRHAADLVLTGGGAALRNLPEFLSDALGIPVRRASNYLDGESCRLQHRSGKQLPLEVLACAVGLALEP